MSDVAADVVASEAVASEMVTSEVVTSGGVAGEVAGGARRADAQRNHDALLKSAAAAFGARGVDASLEDIARGAGVGIGTLYRHFPSRDALVEAAYRRGVEDLCDAVSVLLAENTPEVALDLWMRRFVDYVATKRGLAATLKLQGDEHNELFAYVHDRIRSAIGSLLETATAAGTIRADVDGADLLRALGGICMMSDVGDWKAQAYRLIGLLMDGLRYGVARP